MAGTETACQWDSLPSEALLCIFKHLGLVSSRSCSPVCKHWALVAESPSIWGGFLPKGVFFETHGEVKQHVIKRLTTKLYTWGSKVVDVPGASLKNRLTNPTIVPGRLMGLDSGEVGGSWPETCNAEWSNVQEVVAGGDFCAMLSWDGYVMDTRSRDNRESQAYSSIGSSSYGVLVRNWNPPGDRIISLAAGGGSDSSPGGGGHVLAVSSAGKVWTWGCNLHGQLGIGCCEEFVYYPEECSLPESETIIGAACGANHSAIWSSARVLYTCGDNTQGACGHKSLSDPIQRKVDVFLQVDVHVEVVQAACSDANTVFCDSKGLVWVTGQSSNGQCGLSACQSTSIFGFVQIDLSLTPKTAGKLKQKVPCAEPNKIVTVAASRATIYALTSMGEVFAWGRGSQGELGTGGSCKCQSVPSKLPWASNIKTIKGSSKGQFAAAIDVRGRLFTWGEGKYGQLGHGDTSRRTTGRGVKYLYGCEVVNVACGSDFVMAVTSWKMSARHKKLKCQACPTQGNFAMEPTMPPSSVEEEILTPPKDSITEPCPRASGSSPIQLMAPGISRAAMKKIRKRSHNMLPIGLDLGGSIIDGELSDTDYGVLIDSSGSSTISSSTMCSHSPSSNTSNELIQVQAPIRMEASAPIQGNHLHLREGSSSSFSLVDLHQAGKGNPKKTRTRIKQIVKAFANDPKRRDLFFPSTLTNSDRYNVHKAAENFGVAHKSVGQEPNRQVRVWKPSESRRPLHLNMHDYDHQTPEFDAFSLCKSARHKPIIFDNSAELEGKNLLSTV